MTAVNVPHLCRCSTVLNLPTTASAEEIRDRYRQLSLIFHPDKQVDAQLREAATQNFLRIQKAYEGIVPSQLYVAWDSRYVIHSPVRCHPSVRCCCCYLGVYILTQKVDGHTTYMV